MQQHVIRAWAVRAKGAPRRNASGDLKLRKVSKERDICLRVRGTKGEMQVEIWKLKKVSKERDICLRVRGTKGRVYVDNRSD